MSHRRIEELLAVRALGGLDGSDLASLKRELAEHGACAECRRLEDEFAETAAMLAYALTPESVNPAMADAILAASLPVLTSVPDTPEPVRSEQNDDLSGPRRRRSSWRTAVGLAAAFVLVMVSGALGLRSGRSVPVSSSVLIQRIVHFQGDTGSLTAAYTPGEAGAVLFGSGLPKPGDGRVYEIWTITDNQAASAGCWSSSDGSLHASVTADVGNAELLAVTIERKACPSAPTQAPILTAPVPV